MHKIMTGFSSSCGACKFLRRRCTIECIFAPYFNYEEAAIHFGAVHKVFGASNFSKLLLQLPDVQSRSNAAIAVSYEALARMQDPVYGCVAHIFALQQQVACLKEEIQIISSGMMMNVGVVSAANCAVLSNEMSGIRADCNDQQCLPMEPSRDVYVNETCYGYMEMECLGIEGSGLNAYLDAGFIEKLFQELSQDHYG